MAIIKRMKLGEMLLEGGILNDAQLQLALEEQLKTHKRLGEILVDMRMVDQDVLIDFLSKQLKIPRIALPEVEIEPSALDQLPAEFCRKNLVCPIAIENNKYKIALADPMNIFLIDEIEHRTGMKVVPNLEAAQIIRSTLEKVYSGGGNLDDVAHELKGQESSGSDEDGAIDLKQIEGPIVALAHQIIEKALQEKASDIHIEPGEKSLRVRYRVDGVLTDLLKIPPSIQRFSSELVSRFKLMANMDISERRLPQDGRIRVTHGDRSLDLRVNTMPVSKGEKVCMRILDAASTKLSLKDR